MIVSVAPNSDYLLAEPSSNGKWEQFAQINVRDNEPTTLQFQFVDSDTDEPVELTRFVITVFDIDEQIDSTIQSEQVCVDADDVYDVIAAGGSLNDMGSLTAITTDYNEDSVTIELVEESCRGGPGSSYRVHSTRPGWLCDNPTDPLDLSPVSCEECDACTDKNNHTQYFPINHNLKSR